MENVMNDTIVADKTGFRVIPEAIAKKQGIHNPHEAVQEIKLEPRLIDPNIVHDTARANFLAVYQSMESMSAQIPKK